MKQLLFLLSILAAVLSIQQASKALLEVTEEEPVGVWHLATFFNDEHPDRISVIAYTFFEPASDESTGEKPRVRIGCYNHSNLISATIYLPTNEEYRTADDTMLHVTYSADDRAKNVGQWKFTSPNLDRSDSDDAIPSLVVPRTQWLDLVNVLGTGDTLHLRVYLENGRIITHDYDITGSRIIVPRIKFLCNLVDPDESPDT